MHTKTGDLLSKTKTSNAQKEKYKTKIRRKKKSTKTKTYKAQSYYLCGQKKPNGSYLSILSIIQNASESRSIKYVITAELTLLGRRPSSPPYFCPPTEELTWVGASDFILKNLAAILANKWRSFSLSHLCNWQIHKWYQPKAPTVALMGVLKQESVYVIADGQGKIALHLRSFPFLPMFLMQETLE